MICNWFQGSELSMSLSLMNSSQYLGQTICSLKIPDYYLANLSLPNTFLFCSKLMLTNLVAFVFIAVLDRKRELYDQGQQIISQNEVALGFAESLRGMKRFNLLFWLIGFSTFIAYGCMQYNNNIQNLLIEEYNVPFKETGFYIAMQFIIQLPLTPLMGWFTGTARPQRTGSFLTPDIPLSLSLSIGSRSPIFNHSPILSPSKREAVALSQGLVSAAT